jgi:hypothetical protein
MASRPPALFNGKPPAHPVLGKPKPQLPAPPPKKPPAHGVNIGRSLISVTDSVAETKGAGVVFIDSSKVSRLRNPGPSGITVVYEVRPRGKGGAPAAKRTQGTSPTAEWVNFGFNCGGAVLTWVGVAGLAGLTPVTGGVSGVGAAMLTAGALASTGQCAVSAYRIYNMQTGHQDVNDALDKNETYVWTMRGADAIGLIGAGGALKELKIAHGALSAKGFSTAAVASAKGLSRPARKQITAALGLQGGKRAAAPLITKFVRQRLLEGVGGVIGGVSSAVGGNIKEVSVYIMGLADGGDD